MSRSGRGVDYARRRFGGMVITVWLHSGQIKTDGDPQTVSAGQRRDAEAWVGQELDVFDKPVPEIRRLRFHLWGEK